MALWTLIITFYVNGSAITSQQVQGFKSEQTCEVALARFEKRPQGLALYGRCIKVE